ncbi:MAG: DUF5011 domain-containing protein [Patescibacteria group bacterium]
MKNLIAPTLLLAVALVPLSGCPPAAVTPGDTQKNWPMANTGLVPSLWVHFNEDECHFLTDLFIDLPDANIENVGVMMWCGNYSTMKFTTSGFSPNCPERLAVTHEFPPDVGSVAVTLVARHATTPNPATTDGLYWAYLPNLTCTVDGEPQEEAEDANGPLGYWLIPVNQPGQRSLLLAFMTRFTSYIMVGDEFVDPGATAVDNIDGDITSHIIASGSIDSRQPGFYYLSYDVADSTGNWALTVIRDVVIEPSPLRATLWLTYDSVWPKAKIEARLYQGLEHVSLAFPGVTDWSQIRRVDVIRYYDTVSTPPWSAIEGKDLAGATRPLRFFLSPGRTPSLRFNLVARRQDGSTVWANPDYINLFFNGELTAKDLRSTWTCQL